MTTFVEFYDRDIREDKDRQRVVLRRITKAEIITRVKRFNNNNNNTYYYYYHYNNIYVCVCKVLI